MCPSNARRNRSVAPALFFLFVAIASSLSAPHAAEAKIGSRRPPSSSTAGPSHNAARATIPPLPSAADDSASPRVHFAERRSSFLMESSFSP
mmetsp:Transcript_37590/g.69494  ORF Transcript_37590/g.69494 Transcript_37590/m.69494 type:complete len:92 (+) Transcript_37590:117-392(+)|eukprot:CAMPEP_0197462832 /NCGR_PEP_ID=MMETSP1175-20131217/60124_1 /TAXON_ID=1003142 /ORGANISM="Triceratium dubium, Strain CCMP147" /LENGTH=91 /DNA_ID=CAMNT_0042998435 /DNA_START=116 /DNA_END=391 /DNA_ORIENTATION=+